MKESNLCAFSYEISLVRGRQRGGELNNIVMTINQSLSDKMLLYAVLTKAL